MPTAILIVDKPSQCVETYQEFFVKKGYSVFTAATLESAEVLLGTTPCSLAFISSDLVNDLDSRILHSLKKSDKNCKFVLMTASFDAEVFLRVLHGSIFHECLNSPLDLSLLDDIVYHLIHLDDDLPDKSRTPSA